MSDCTDSMAADEALCAFISRECKSDATASRVAAAAVSTVIWMFWKALEGYGLFRLAVEGVIRFRLIPGMSKQKVG